MSISKINPKVSIITTCFNSEKTVGDTLRSVESQDYPNIEHIIVDGASKDRTLDIIKHFPHVSHVISEPDKGVYDAMNKGLNLASGSIIGFLNSDDFYVGPDVIRSVVHQMEDKHSSALYADLVYVDPVNTSRIIRSWKAEPYSESKFLFGWMPPHPTFFVKKEVYDRLGGFDLSLRSSADYELMLRFLYKHKIDVTYLPKIIIKMRTGGMSNASLTNRLRANKEDRLAWRTNKLNPYFFTAWLKPIRKITQFLRSKTEII